MVIIYKFRRGRLQSFNFSCKLPVVHGPDRGDGNTCAGADSNAAYSGQECCGHLQPSTPVSLSLSLSLSLSVCLSLAPSTRRRWHDCLLRSITRRLKIARRISRPPRRTLGLSVGDGRPDVRSVSGWISRLKSITR